MHLRAIYIYNVNEFEATVEPYAIDVLRKCCKICKRSKEYKSESDVQKHFMDKHTNVPMEYDVVKSRHLVQCSDCGKQLRAKKFSKHKFEVHAQHLSDIISQNELPNDVQNISQPEGIEEPYAIEVPLYNCRLCNIRPMTKMILNFHFEVKHSSAPPDFDVVKSDRHVQCSSCGVKMLTKEFSKHKLKVHAQHVTNSNNHDLPNDVHQNINQPEGIEEPYAIDVPLYKCRLCKVDAMNGGMTERMLNIHFEVKHNNANPDFDVVKSDRRVRCSSCGVEMFKKNFSKHILKVHNRDIIDMQGQNKSISVAHHNVNEFKGIVEPLAMDIMVNKCKVCRAEYVTQKYLKRHFEVKHENVPMEFEVVKSNIFVRCSACRTQIKTKHFTRHKQRCVRSQTQIGVSSQKQPHMTNNQVCHEAVTSELNNPLVEEKGKCTRFITKECEASVNAHIMSPRLFGCKICGANILEQNITKHQLEHSTHYNRTFSLKSLNNDFYLLDSKKQVLRLQCEICKVECNENHLERHMRRVHSKSLVMSENDPSIANHSKRSLNDVIQVNTGQQLIAIEVYKCLACDARDIMEPNLIRHHLKKHAQISIEINIFQMIGRILREKCNMCQRYLPQGRVKEHKKRSHYNKTRLVVFNPVANMPSWSKASSRTVTQTTKPATIELHKCLNSRAVVSKDKLQVHRKNHKGKVSKREDLFKLIGIKNVIKCAACLKFIEPETFREHLKKHSTMIFVSADGTPLLNPEPEKFEQKTFVTQQNSKYLPKYRNIYKCRACEIIKGKKKFIGDWGLDGMDIQKHQRAHREHSIKGNIFRLFMVKVKCNVCDRYMKEDKVEKHMKIVHKWNYDINFVQLYKCGGCDAHGISKRNLEAHHSRMHNFPIERNDFKISAIKQKIECDCCGKRYMEGRSKKHHLKTCLQRALAIETVLDEQKTITVFEDEPLAVDDIFEEYDNN